MALNAAAQDITILNTVTAMVQATVMATVMVTVMVTEPAMATADMVEKNKIFYEHYTRHKRINTLS
jgi:hypothetical protein